MADVIASEKLREYVREKNQDAPPQEPDNLEGPPTIDLAVGYQLNNTHEGIGQALYRTKTYDEAKEVVEPYVRLLAADQGPSNDLLGFIV